MQNLHREIGKRLKYIRSIFFNGEKISVRLFASALGETKDNIANYENGRAGIPARLFLELYKQGYNPTYIISGDGEIYADNVRGLQLMKLEDSNKQKPNIKRIYKADISKLNFNELVEHYRVLTAAAGDMMKALEKNQK